jgi:spermidine/putrescine transport system permease protein/putrescine transport system permease protein
MIWATPMLIWQIAFFIFPLLFMVVITFWTVENFQMKADLTLENWVGILTAKYFWSAYIQTIGYAALAAVIASVIAFPCAYALAFHVNVSTRWFAILLLIVPFFTSYLVRIYSWKVVLTKNGMINKALGYIGIGPFDMVNNVTGTMVGYLTLVLPLVALLQLMSLSYVDRNLVGAAHNLRCGPLRTVFLVVIPSAKVGLTLAATFAFILVFGDYMSPSLLGASKPATMSILIVDTIKSGANWPEAATVALIMIVTLMVAAFGALTFAYGLPSKGRRS